MAEPRTDDRQTRRETGNRRNGVVAFACLAFVGAMVGMAYASVPLYQLFCKVTGYAGTTREATAAPDRVVDRVFEVRLDANVAGVPWTFEPEAPSVRVRAGEVVTANFRITSRAEEATEATATFNVTPLNSGAFFNKISCFCFTEQTLAAGESREIPVVFFVDPAIVDEHDLDAVKTITLSYTFFPPAKGKERLAAVPAAAGASIR
ncbi:MAG: cytochrome c oxidase assembly protein [Hyphomicrobiales bacterium]